MTREEALARVSTLLRKRGEGLDSSHRYAGASIAACEALGLIEFEDEARDAMNAEVIRTLHGMEVSVRTVHTPFARITERWPLSMNGAARLLDDLRQRGLKVVRA